MQLSDESVKRFVEIYEKEFGEKLPLEKGGLMAGQVLRLYELLARSLPSEMEKSNNTEYEK